MKHKYSIFIFLLANFTVKSQKETQQIVYKDTVQQLSEVVITASRTPENVLKSPIEYLERCVAI